jgi:hypothetical protein
MAASTFDHERLDVDRFSIEYITISCQIAGALDADLTDPTKQTESEKQIEYEYRDAEYEYEPNSVNQGGEVLPSRIFTLKGSSRGLPGARPGTCRALDPFLP